MAEAWAMFDKAVAAEEKVIAALAEGNESKARMATKLVNKRLDNAVALEAEAVS